MLAKIFLVAQSKGSNPGEEDRDSKNDFHWKWWASTEICKLWKAAMAKSCYSVWEGKWSSLQGGYKSFITKQENKREKDISDILLQYKVPHTWHLRVLFTPRPDAGERAGEVREKGEEGATLHAVLHSLPRLIIPQVTGSQGVCNRFHILKRAAQLSSNENSLYHHSKWALYPMGLWEDYITSPKLWRQ